MTQQDSLAEDPLEIGAQLREAPRPTSGRRSKVVNFYANRSVLITGASGFIGKVLIEKLLRSCPGLRRIFVLIRPKWNKQPEARLRELLEAPLFDGVRDQSLGERVVLVEGDVTLANLGLGERNLLRIMNEVSVIFHSAATVKFDEPLKQSIGINIAGTKNMIELCRRCPQLAALVHVSTAYANCDRQEIDEHIYPMDSLHPERLIQMADWLDQDTLQELKRRLLGPRPNTYTYTKALAEWLLVKSARDLPVVICRPSIVVASWREPFGGWIDNVNGPTGIVLGAGKGLIRSMSAESDYVADLVPVDQVINLVITLGWFASVYKNHKQLNDAAESFIESLDVSAASGSSSAGTRSPLSALSSAGFDDDEDEDEEDGHEKEEEEDGHGKHGRVTPARDLTSEAPGSDNDELSSSSSSSNNNNNHHPSDLFAGRQPSGGPAESGPGSSLDDPGYGSRSPGYASSLASSSSCRRGAAGSGSGGNNNAPSLASRQLREARGGKSPLPADSKEQSRLLDERQAAFEYKLKQFRHQNRNRLLAKGLPEELADVPVFHCTSGGENPITWGRVQVLVLALLAAYPSATTYRYPCGSFTNNKRLDNFYRLTLHYVPAYLVDLVTRLCGGKPLLVKIFRKFDQAAGVLKAFTMNQWQFNYHNRRWLIEELMSDEDRRLFCCDIKRLNWADYMRDYVLGVRKFMLKEPIGNLPQARRNLRLVYYRNLTLQTLLVLLISYYFLSVTGWLGWSGPVATTTTTLLV